MLLIVVVACVAVGGLLSSTLQSDPIADGRALVPCVVGPLLALSWRTELVGRFSGPLIGGVATTILLVGLGSHAAVLATRREAPIAVVVALGLATVAALAATTTSLLRARAAPGALWRNRVRTEAAGVGLVGVATLLAGIGSFWPWRAGDAWPAIVALGAALTTSARVNAWPLVGRDVALVVGGAFAAAVIAPGASGSIVAAAAVATGAVVGQGLFGQPAPRAVGRAMDGLRAAAEPPAGVFGIIPLLDHEGLRRATRPRVLARTSARRLIDAAIDRAWRAAGARGRPPIDVAGGEDVEVDGDAGELAEALCSILDHALQGRPSDADGRIMITLRTAPATVGIEFDGVALPQRARPFMDGVEDASGAGDLVLARARVLIERHGGQLHVRSGGRGAVHLTLPRRVQRGTVGLA